MDLLPEDSLYWRPAHAYDFHDYTISSGKLSGLLSLEQSRYVMTFPSLDMCLQNILFLSFLKHIFITQFLVACMFQKSLIKILCIWITVPEHPPNHSSHGEGITSKTVDDGWTMGCVKFECLPWNSVFGISKVYGVEWEPMF